MTERAGRTTVICGTIAGVLTFATAIATWHIDRFYPVMLLFIVGAFYSNQLYVGYIPLPIPRLQGCLSKATCSPA